MNSLRRPFGPLCAAACATLLYACGSSGGSVEGTGTTGATLVIEGTIAGLQGSGLVISYNGTRDQTMQAAIGSFFFDKIAEKSSYVITIKTQPTSPSQTCVVTANGTGSIKFDPIRNIAITCTTNTYAVKGNIVGLTGTGMTLLLNGAGTQTVAPGTNVFVFPPIESGMRYAVTIGTQPTGQTCAVNAGTGTVGALDVTNVAVSCSGAGSTVGGTLIGLSSNGLSLSLNGGTPLPIPGGSLAFTFPTVLQTGADYGVTITSQPVQTRQTCVLARGRGRMGTGDITLPIVRCVPNTSLDSYGGTYVVTVNGRRNYLTVWLDGSYSLANRVDDPTCANNGNGREYGVYKRATSGVFSINYAFDDTGTCGLWFGGPIPATGGGFEGTMVRNGNTLTLTSSGGALVAEAVESVPTSLVGAFTRADGMDGSFLVFESDGTYLFQETQQQGGSLSSPAGYERGCYTVSGTNFTISLATTCRPEALPALDLNGVAGFSGSNGAPIPFVITSPTTATINGVKYIRTVPEG